jgi:cephalosporin hydroxylase
MTNSNNQDAINKFHELFYYNRTWSQVYWMGIQTYKCPFDLWIYQEILFEIKPDVIIECGTAFGGTSLFLAHIFDLMQIGKVITIDINEQELLPKHQRIHYLKGSTTSDDTINIVQKLISDNEKVLVILDSAHNKEHVLREIQLYSDLVTVGSYLIVEDSNINGHPVYTDYQPDRGLGPMEAIEEFLGEDSRYIVDSIREKFMFTFNPKGYLKRIH